MEEENYNEKVIALVDTFFEDSGTAERWMRIKNPLLGGLSPRDMIKMGRGEKLYEFVQNQLKENQDYVQEEKSTPEKETVQDTEKVKEETAA